MPLVSCSGVDVYTAVAGAVGALYGPLHGGANEAVLRMLERIGSVENIPGESLQQQPQHTFVLRMHSADQQPTLPAGMGLKTALSFLLLLSGSKAAMYIVCARCQAAVTRLIGGCIHWWLRLL